MKLSYKGIEAGDYVKVYEESINPNCDGWGRDLPKQPWDDTSYTAQTMFGSVHIHIDQDGSRAELHFHNRQGWNRPISSFDHVEKITEAQMIDGRDHQEGYEKDKNGNPVPCGTAKMEYCRRHTICQPSNPNG